MSELSSPAHNRPHGGSERRVTAAKSSAFEQMKAIGRQEVLRRRAWRCEEATL
jgi:hypothetical protein